MHSTPNSVKLLVIVVCCARASHHGYVVCSPVLVYEYNKVVRIQASGTTLLVLGNTVFVGRRAKGTFIAKKRTKELQSGWSEHPRRASAELLVERQCRAVVSHELIVEYLLLLVDIIVNL